MGYHILINENAGTVLKIGAEVLRTKAYEILGDSIDEFEFVAPDQIMTRLESMDDERCVLVGGGDGTITTIASHLIKKEHPFGIIPLGTMNLFAQDIGVPNNWEDALKAYKNSDEHHVDVGFANGELFLCNAMFGVTTQIAKEREASRNMFRPTAWLRLLGSFWQKFSQGSSRYIKITSGIKNGHLAYKSIVVSNNRYRDEIGPGCNLKQSLQDGNLSIYVINPQTGMESAALMARLAAGGWQKEAYVENFDTKKIIFNRSKKHIAVLLDGEEKQLKMPLRFEIRPKALSVLVPKACEKEKAA